MKINNPYARPSKGGTPWVILILIFIVAWPLGVFFLANKLKADQRAIFTGPTVLLPLGVLLIIAALGGFSSGNESDRMMATYWFVGGIYLVYKGVRLSNKSGRYRLCLHIIINENKRRLDEIGKRLSAYPWDYRRTLIEMTSEGVLNGYVDEEIGELILWLPGEERERPSGRTRLPSEPLLPETVCCKNCGANNTVSKSGWVCEYCGSELGVE